MNGLSTSPAGVCSLWVTRLSHCSGSNDKDASLVGGDQPGNEWNSPMALCCPCGGSVEVIHDLYLWIWTLSLGYKFTPLWDFPSLISLLSFLSSIFLPPHSLSFIHLSYSISSL
ncbi:hypothetical protein ASPBRDRAFT_551038 [Aspergillus brasiliensis CBS 101740]|uniref:Uncharacterized protein n=1 Tax=Aspergillus brasiliensis (strain CBS 101740 / IMI 381727 / IBT 21946) TaxID=767769 RepID=A0A1L9UM21_ASPBC|nr:hypothetical protein ASPBRDRAFT_551038 [Aspergillus brasiliensis CBS 101740]